MGEREEIHGKKKVIDLYYETIGLSQLDWQDLFNIGLKGLYPLLSLTRDGTRREAVERMFGELGETGKTDLELIAFTLASYKFAKLDVDEDWLIRRFYKMHDFLVESPIYQLILQEGRQEGRDEALQQGLQQEADGNRSHRLLLFHTDDGRYVCTMVSISCVVKGLVR